ASTRGLQELTLLRQVIQARYRVRGVGGSCIAAAGRASSEEDSMISARRSIALGLGLALCASAPARAQYFGRNPVQWERLKFEVLKTEHFDVYHYAENQRAAEQVGRMAERWYTRLSGILE